MREKFVPIAWRLHRFSALFVLLVAYAVSAQTPTRLISWQPHTLGLVQMGGEGVRLSSGVEALEIVDFTVEDKSVTLGESFTAGDEWLKTLRVRVRNVSGQTITRAQMNFVLAESRANGRPAIIVRLQCGSVSAENAKPIQPGEEFELTMREWNYNSLKEKIAERKDPALLNTLWIMVMSAHFADETIWSSGCVKATNPKNSCPRPAA